jgi:hypothetical protein
MYTVLYTTLEEGKLSDRHPISTGTDKKMLLQGEVLYSLQNFIHGPSKSLRTRIFTLSPLLQF